MDKNILRQLVAQQIPVDHFHFEGDTLVFTDPEKNSKPCTAPNESPYDTPENRAIVAEVIANYDTLAAEFVQQQLMVEVVSAVQSFLDTTAQQRGYDNIFTLISYVTSTNPVFQREGQAGLFWRDRVWETCLQIKNDVIAEIRPVPTEEEVLAEMPVIDWGE